MSQVQSGNVGKAVATIALSPPPRWLELLGGLCPKGDFVNSSWFQTSTVAMIFGFQVCVALIAALGS